MNTVRHHLPCGNVLLTPYPRNVGPFRTLLRDERALSHDESCATFGSLRIILDIELVWDIGGNSPVPSERRHYISVAHSEVAEL